MGTLEQFFRFSAVESEKLGDTVLRADLPADARVPDLTRFIDHARQKAALTIIRCEIGAFDVWRFLLCQGIQLFDVIEEYRGFPETIASDPSSSCPDEVRRLEPIDSRSRAECLRLCEEVFKDVHNHYSLDPRIPRSWVAGGYQDWLDRIISQSSESRGVWMRNDGGGELAGFLAWQVMDSGALEICLYGVRHTFRGRGIARELIRTAARNFWATRSGKQPVILPTQAWNYQSKRSAICAGLLPSRTYLTFHLWRD